MDYDRIKVIIDDDFLMDDARLARVLEEEGVTMTDLIGVIRLLNQRNKGEREILDYFSLMT